MAWLHVSSPGGLLPEKHCVSISVQIPANIVCLYICILGIFYACLYTATKKSLEYQKSQTNIAYIAAAAAILAYIDRLELPRGS